jgi:branched-chain amino acid transport system permease protein
VLGFGVLAVVVLTALFVARLRISGLGQRMLAVRSNERAAAAAGVSVRNTKFAAFGISSFIAGVGGVLYAYSLGSVSPERFGILIALGFVAFAYVGGITMVSGAVFGGLIASEGLVSYFTQDAIGISGTWTLLMGGVLLLLNLVFVPEGIAGSQYQKRKQKRAAKQRAAAPPSPPSPVTAVAAGGDR